MKKKKRGIILKELILVYVCFCIICAFHLIMGDIGYQKQIKIQEKMEQQKWIDDIDNLWEEMQERKESIYNLDKLKLRLI